MTEKEYQAKIEANSWHKPEELQGLVDLIKSLTREGKTWSWIKNGECKYIDIRIDMRDGGFVLKNREGRRISPMKLKSQGEYDG
jgi:hypothetical protein